VLRRVPSLFVRNERVTVHGAWEHGFMGVVCVGAYNVGSIHLSFDENRDITGGSGAAGSNAGADTDDDDFLRTNVRSPEWTHRVKTFSTPRTAESLCADGTAAAKAAKAAAAAAVRGPNAQAPRNPFFTWIARTFGDHNDPANIARLRRENVVINERDVTLDAGAEMARFELGSTVVLVFEGPDGDDGDGDSAAFKFAVRPGDTVKMGTPLGDVHA
jgi:phosphatidylserine decarboxylase